MIREQTGAIFRFNNEKRIFVGLDPRKFAVNKITIKHNVLGN